MSSSHRNGKRSVIDGPFTDPKELIAVFFMVQDALARRRARVVQSVREIIGEDRRRASLTAAAKEFLKENPAPETLTDKTGSGPKVTFARGVDAAAEKLDCCWTLTPQIEAAAAAPAPRPNRTSSIPPRLRQARHTRLAPVWIRTRVGTP